MITAARIHVIIKRHNRTPTNRICPPHRGLTKIMLREIDGQAGGKAAAFLIQTDGEDRARPP